jgi:hypothetical protein
VVGQIQHHLGAIITMQVISASLLLARASISELFPHSSIHTNIVIEAQTQVQLANKTLVPKALGGQFPLQKTLLRVCLPKLACISLMEVGSYTLFK